MPGANDRTGLLATLQSELRSRNVPVPDAASHQWPPFDWSIRRDEFGFTVLFPIDHFRAVADWVEVVLGAPKFAHDHGQTRIHRDDNACVTIMVTTTDSAGQLILLHWKDSAVTSKISERRAAAIQQTIDAAAQDACAAVQQAIDSVGSREEEATWSTATAKLHDVHDALNKLISSHDVTRADPR
jgi:hypothetical protein